MAEGVNYQPVSPDPQKSCKNCKNFEADVEKESFGKCFGHEVIAAGTCNFYEPKE